jgi:hypothetical protein
MSIKIPRTLNDQKLVREVDRRLAKSTQTTTRGDVASQLATPHPSLEPTSSGMESRDSLKEAIHDGK